MKIFVTGLGGVIGSSLAKGLNKKGAIIIDSNLHKFRDDIQHIEKFGDYLNDVDGIIHLAAVSRVQLGEEQRDHCWKTNVLGTKNILNIVLGLKHKPWFIFASSREVYGKQKNLPITERASLNPQNFYGITKKEGETLVAQAAELGVKTAIIRYSNVYGASHDRPERIVPTLCRKALSGETMPIRGFDAFYDFTHIDDVVEGTCSVAETLQQNRLSLPTVHLATGTGTSLGKLAEIIKKLSGSKADIVAHEPLSYDSPNFIGDPSFSFELLGWKAKVQLDEGLKQLLHHYSPSEKKTMDAKIGMLTQEKDFKNETSQGNSRLPTCV